MNPLQAAVARVWIAIDVTVGVSPVLAVVTLVRLGERVNRLVRYVVTFDEADPLQLGETGQLHHGLIREVRTAAEVDVTNARTAAHQSLDCVVGDLRAVPQVEVVKVPAQLGNGIDAGIGDVSTLGENQIAQARSRFDYLLHRAVRDARTRCQVQDPELLVCCVVRERQESIVIDELAARQSQFPQRKPLGQKGRDWLVPDESALVQIHLENVRAVFCQSQYGLVRQLSAVVQF
jgi:hypothetical protein